MEYDKSKKQRRVKVTDYIDEVDFPYPFTEEIQLALEQLHLEMDSEYFKGADEIIKRIEKYPEVPTFKNMLVMFYVASGNMDKAKQANHWLLKEHPDYLYGLLNLCAEYMDEGLFDRIPKILGERLDLSSLYPSRKVFHVEEFKAFLRTSCAYLFQVEDFKGAADRILMAEEMFGDEDETVLSLVTILDQESAYLFEDDDEFENGYEPKVFEQTEAKPVFHHKEIWALYENDLTIDPEILRKILSLPRKTLIEDLEKVLLDSCTRFDYFYYDEDDVLFEKKDTTFPMHAMALLAELGAKESITNILQLFSNGDDFNDFWFDDHLTETVWYFVYRLYQDDIEQLKKFMLDPAFSQWPKIIIGQAVVQIAFEDESRVEEVIQWQGDLLAALLENIENPLICDPGVISNLVSDLSQLPAKDYLPLIKRCYDAELVEIFFCGPYQELEKEILATKDKLNVWSAEVHKDIFAYYKYIITTWFVETDDDSVIQKREAIDSLKKERDEAVAEVARLKALLKEKAGQLQKTKAGRNDPCPCGSGKKYKKCCL